MSTKKEIREELECLLGAVDIHTILTDIFLPQPFVAIRSEVPKHSPLAEYPIACLEDDHE